MNFRFETLRPGVTLLVLGGSLAFGQAATATVDPVLDAGQSLVGRALFLRGGFGAEDLEYDAQGHVKGQPKVVDWTLAAVDIQKAARRQGSGGGSELELDGVRVAMRYNPDQHIFERHPQKDTKLKILLALNPDGHGVQGALAAMFAVGIDPALQRAMPAYWRHYFSPALAWPNDEITGLTVVPANAPPGSGVEFPVLEKKAEPDFTSEARQDRVKGTVQLRMTIAPDGVPRRISVKQPLGYGLDERAVEAATKLRFRPGMKDGQPVAVEMILNQLFDVAPAAR